MAREERGPFFYLEAKALSLGCARLQLASLGMTAWWRATTGPEYSEDRIDEGGGAADPFEILVVVHAHHLAASHADEGHHGCHALTFGPDVHDADLGLRFAVRRRDGRGKCNTLLQDVVVALGPRNCVELLVRRSEDDSGAGERIER